MSTLVTYRKAVQSRLRELLPSGPDGVRTVTTHVGEFGPRELQEYAVSAPAVIAAPLGMPDVERLGHGAVVTLNYAAYVVTKSMAQDSRGDIALAVLEVLLADLPTQRWGVEACASVPTDIDAGNLYTGPVDDMGVSLWAVRWRQRVNLQPTDTSTLADFLTLAVVDFNLDDPADENDFPAEQTITLPQSE